MSFRGIIVGAVAGFAWLFLVQVLLRGNIVQLSPAGANWLTFGGLAAVWAAVVLLTDRFDKKPDN